MNCPPFAQRPVDIDRVLNSILWYAQENHLTSEQLADIFHSGLAECVKSGKINVPLLDPIPSFRSGS